MDWGIKARFVRRAAWIVILALSLLRGHASCWAGDGVWAAAEEPIRFLRIVRQEDGEPQALEAAIIRCGPVDGDGCCPIVDLVSAVHMAEPEFYAQLNRAFRNYDAVLYELVAPEGTKIAKGAGRKERNPVSLLQHGLTDLLQLQFQLEGVDYTQRNLVHADMSPEQFARSMRDRNESFAEAIFRMMGYSMARQNDRIGGTSDARLLMALLTGNRAMALRRAMAEQFETMQDAWSVIDGTEGSTLIAERNKVALAVLRRELAAGRRKLAVFYGAGHMDDMLTRLRDDFALTPRDVRWLTAWRLQ